MAEVDEGIAGVSLGWFYAATTRVTCFMEVLSS